MIRIELKRKLATFIVFLCICLSYMTFIFLGKNFVIEMSKTMEQNFSVPQSDITNSIFWNRYMRDEIHQIANIDDAGYIWTQWNATNFAMIFILFVMIIGLLEFSPSKDDKRYYFYLNFVSRRKYYISKLVSGLILLCALIVIVFCVVLIWGLIKGWTIAIPELLSQYPQLMIMGLFIYTLCVFLSLIFRNRVNGFLIIFIFSLIYISTMALFPAVSFSLRINRIYFMPNIAIWLLPLLLSISALFSYIGYRWFQKIDL